MKTYGVQLLACSAEEERREMARMSAFVNAMAISGMSDKLTLEKSEINLKLSSKGISNIPAELYDGVFEFKISGMRHICSTFIAEFISPKISALRRVDPTVCEYELETEDPLGKFGEFLSLPFESDLRVSSDNLPFLLSVSLELENEEVFSQLISAFDRTEITPSNAVNILRVRQSYHRDDEKEIAFIASHFSEIENLASLETHLLRRVLCHSSLTIESEDSLYKFIFSLIEKDSSYTELLECVIFKFLSRESIEHFIALSLETSFIFENLNLPLWNCICDRLLQEPLLESDSLEEKKSRFGLRPADGRPAPVTERKGMIRSHFYTGENPFGGIIYDLKQRWGGDISGVIEVTASGIGGDAQPHQILDFDWNDYFFTENEPNSWIMLDMKNYRVSPTHYTLKSMPGRQFCFSQWVIECTNDPSDWSNAVVVDARDTNDLILESKVKTYPVRNLNNSFYRYIRMRQTGENTSMFTCHCLALANIELFGTIQYT